MSPTIETTDLRHLLEVASVQGSRFHAEVFAQVSGIPLYETVRLLSDVPGRDEQLVMGLDPECSQEACCTPYQFRHVLIQRFLYDSLDSAQRTLWHRQIGELLETRGTRDDEFQQ